MPDGLARASRTAEAGHARRVAALDGLRGLAVLAVLVFHYTTRYEALFGRHLGGIPFHFPWGKFGVEGFFVISGFVIALTLERTRSLAEFLRARFARLYPAFLTCLLLTTAVTFLAGPPATQPGVRVFLSNLTMMPLTLGAPNVDGSYWSLRFELAFYALVAVCWFGLRLRRLDWFALAWVLVVTAMRSHNPGQYSAGLQLATCMPWANFFVLGIVVSEWAHERVSLPGLVAAGLALHLTYVSYDWTFIPLSNAGYLLVGIVFAALVLAAATVPPGWRRPDRLWRHTLLGRPVAASAARRLALQATGGLTALLSARPLTFLGSISYALYLLHQAIGFIVIHHLEQSGLGGTSAILITALLAGGLATLVTYAVEIPARRLLARGHFRREATPPPAS